jgi:hypothetical protein
MERDNRKAKYVFFVSVFKNVVIALCYLHRKQPAAGLHYTLQTDAGRVQKSAD